MQQTTTPQSFQKSFTNEVWATFPPTQITLCFCAQTFYFPKPSSSFVWDFFQREVSLIINVWAAVCQYTPIKVWECVCARKLSYMKRPKHLSYSFISSASLHLSDTLRSLWESHMSNLHCHSKFSGQRCTSLFTMQIKFWPTAADRQTANIREKHHTTQTSCVGALYIIQESDINSNQKKLQFVNVKVIYCVFCILYIFFFLSYFCRDIYTDVFCYLCSYGWI